MILPTNNGKWFLVVLGALYLASITSQSGLLLLLIGILGGCFLINFVHALKTVRQVQVTPPFLTSLSEGERLSQPWQITNRGRRPAGLLEVVSMAGSLLRVAKLAPGESARLVPSLTLKRRGVYPCGEIHVTTTFPFGLLRASQQQNLPGEIVVYPALYSVPVPAAAGYDMMVGGKHRGARRTTSGAYFAGVRPLQPGDPLKQIHWKSSSKGLGLMVKTYDEELSGRLAVIIDPGHSGDAKVLDNCVRAAGSLMFAALDEGHHVEWIELGALEPHLTPPFDDGHEILDALARLQMKRPCLTLENLTQAVAKVSHKSAICLVLTEYNEAVGKVTQQLRQRNRTVSLYLPESCGAMPSEAAIFRYGERYLKTTA